jgi:hypothetical protein
MAQDEPAEVAERIIGALQRGRSRFYAPDPERFFVALQRLAPALVDMGLGGRRRKPGSVVT